MSQRAGVSDACAEAAARAATSALISTQQHRCFSSMPGSDKSTAKWCLAKQPNPHWADLLCLLLVVPLPLWPLWFCVLCSADPQAGDLPSSSSLHHQGTHPHGDPIRTQGAHCTSGQHYRNWHQDDDQVSSGCQQPHMRPDTAAALDSTAQQCRLGDGCCGINERASDRRAAASGPK